MITRIGKCRACKQTSRKDYVEVEVYQERTNYIPGVNNRPEYQERKRFGRLNAAGRFVRASMDLLCPRCGKDEWNAKRIEGYTTDGPCDARCINAKGPSCDCSCGGANHGKSWLVCDGVSP